MSRNRYVGDYRLVESIDGRGRIKTDYEYIGAAYFYAEGADAARRALRRIAIGCAAGWLAFVGALTPVSSAMRTLFTALPFAFAALPLGLMSGVALGALRAKEPLEHRQIFGITFEQGRQELAIDDQLLSNIVTKNKTIPAEAMRDLKISLITLKYTQSNSVCFVKDGQAIGVGAGQQSRVHCTRLAGGKADNWWLRQSPRVLELPFLEEIARPNRDNAIDVYIGNDSEDVLRDGEWQKVFKVKPDPFTAEQKREWLDKMTDVSLGSDAFFPFSDNIERAVRSGVRYIAEPGGSIRDKDVIDCCDRYGIAMAFTGIRLFHH